MDLKEKKEFLSRGKGLEQLILCNQQELLSLRSVSTCISAIDYSALKVKRSGEQGRGAFTQIVEQMVLLEEQIKKDTEELACLKGRIRNSICSLQNPEERMILQYKYLLGYTWVEIGEVAHVSEATAHRIHQKGLDHLKVERV